MRSARHVLFLSNRSSWSRGAIATLLGACVLAAPASAQPGPWIDPPAASLLGPSDGASGGLVDRLTGPRLARDLAAPSVGRRMRAAEALGRVGAPGPAVDALVDSLAREPVGPVRAAIARALARRGDPRAIPALVEALRTSGGADVESIAAALGAFPTGEAIEALVVAVDDPRLRRAATDALVRAGPRVVPYAIDRLRDVEAPLPLIEALGRIGSPVATAALLDQLAAAQPLVRVAALRALERIGDPRAARAVRQVLEDGSPSVQDAAIAALGAVGAPNDAATLERRLSGTMIGDLAVWEAIVRLDPDRFAVGLAGALPSGEAPPPGLVRLAVDHASPALLPLFERFASLPDFAAAPYAGEFVAALGRVPDARAIALLVRLAGEHPELEAPSAVSLALALDRFGRGFDPPARQAALATIAGLDSPVERLVLRTLARDPAVAPELEAALAGGDAALVWAAAFALASSDGPCPNEALRVAGLRFDGRDRARGTAAGDDAELFRRIAEASLRCGVPAPPSVGPAFLHDPETAPEAMAWVAASRRDAPRHAREALGRELRAALRHADPRVRAGAARALAERHDRAAFRALVRILDDREPSVRRAAARALEVLGVPEAAADIEAVARTVSDPFLLAALDDAARAAERPALRFVRRGDAVYRAPPLDAPADARVVIDLVLPDGRHRRFAPPAGRLLVAGLPYGPVQARVEVHAAGVAAPAWPGPSAARKACGRPADRGTIPCEK